MSTSWKRSRAKHKGLFLWVFLVVRSLQNGMSNRDSTSLLRQRLDEIPADLETFFEKIINSVEHLYREQMELVLQIALLSPEPINLAVLWFLDEPLEYKLGTSGTEFDRRPLAHVEKIMSRRLNGRYKGLLEPTGGAGHLTANFLHRTIRDYLQARKGFGIIALPGLSPFSRVCRALLAYTAICGRGEKGHTVIVLFVVFARWAEQQSETLDSALVHEMIRLTSGGPYPRFSRGILHEMVRYGFLSGLRSLLSQYPEIYKQEERCIIALAMKTQPERARNIFGCQSATDTLNWVLRNVAQPHARMNDRILLLESLMSVQSDNRLQQHGSDISQAFLDLRYVTDFPWFEWNGSEPNEFCSGATMSIRLKKLVNVYSNLLDNGFDSNLSVGNTTVEQSWL
jgi:hypothetical protein